VIQAKTNYRDLTRPYKVFVYAEHLYVKQVKYTRQQRLSHKNGRQFKPVSIMYVEY